MPFRGSEAAAPLELVRGDPFYVRRDKSGYFYGLSVMDDHSRFVLGVPVSGERTAEGGALDAFRRTMNGRHGDRLPPFERPVLCDNENILLGKSVDARQPEHWRAREEKLWLVLGSYHADNVSDHCRRGRIDRRSLFVLRKVSGAVASWNHRKPGRPPREAGNAATLREELEKA